MVQSILTSAEQYMMHMKALLFNSNEIAAKILQTNNVKKIKELGRSREIPFNQEVWDRNKFDIVVRASYLKFSQNKDIKEELLNSGDKILVEASPYDAVWGIKLHWKDDAVLDEKNWKGENLLGKALMKAREILRGEDNV